MLFMHRKRKEMEMQQDSHEDLSCMSCYGIIVPVDVTDVEQEVVRVLWDLQDQPVPEAVREFRGLWVLRDRRGSREYRDIREPPVRQELPVQREQREPPVQQELPALQEKQEQQVRPEQQPRQLLWECNNSR